MRWQPWFYQYILMLAAIALAGAKREVAALNTCCLVLAATYIWSGLAKLNPVFVGTTFPWLLEPFLGAAGEHAQWFVKHAGWLAPMVEFDAVFDRLPDPIQDYVTEEGPNRNGFSILDWSYGEMNVPAYPETRIYKNVARKICAYAADDPSVELVVQEKLAFVNGNRRSVYQCSGLTK